MCSIKFNHRNQPNPEDGLQTERQAVQEARTHGHQNSTCHGLRCDQFGVHLASDGDRIAREKRGDEQGGQEKLYDLVSKIYLESKSIQS